MKKKEKKKKKKTAQMKTIRIMLVAALMLVGCEALTAYCPSASDLTAA